MTDWLTVVVNTVLMVVLTLVNCVKVTIRFSDADCGWLLV